MSEFIGKNISICMLKWSVNGEGFMKFFPNHKFVPGTFSSWKKGKRTPPLEFILRLSDITGISTQSICRGTITENELPIQPILNQPYKQTENKISQVSEPLAEYLGIPEINRRIEAIEDHLKLNQTENNKKRDE